MTLYKGGLRRILFHLFTPPLFLLLPLLPPFAFIACALLLHPWCDLCFAMTKQGQSVADIAEVINSARRGRTVHARGERLRFAGGGED